MQCFRQKLNLSTSCVNSNNSKINYLNINIEKIIIKET